MYTDYYVCMGCLKFEFLNTSNLKFLYFKIFNIYFYTVLEFILIQLKKNNLK